MKLFGKELFKARSTELYDFAQHGLLNIRDDGELMGLVVNTQMEELGLQKKKPGRKPKAKPAVSPKALFKAEALNDNDFSINVDPDYVQKNIDEAERKLRLMMNGKKENAQITWGANHFGREELRAIIERLGNRKNISKAKAVLEKYPHTTSLLINEVVEAHSNLRCKLAGEFIPDMPTEAVEAMEEYNEMCKKVSGKTTHFYVVADKKDFGEVARRRDPILLAQSPFGFFWQILGAWDEEMIYLGDL